MLQDVPVPPKSYHPVAKMLHWLVAVLVIAMIPIGQVMVLEGLPRIVQNTLFLLHKNGGVLVGILMVIRLGVRLVLSPPKMPATVPTLQRRVASAAHWLLYVLVLTMAVSGYLRVVAGGYPIEGLDGLGVPHLIARNALVETIAKDVHYYAHFALIAVILAHVAGALYHLLWLRDGIFARMWPSPRNHRR